MINVEKTIISQYQKSPRLVALVKDIDQFLDPRADIEALLTNIMDVETANGYGLDCLGKIAGVSRLLKITATTPSVGFYIDSLPAGAQPYKPMSYGTFSVSGVTQNYSMADDVYRFVVQAKMLSNIVATTYPALDQVLKNLFPGRGDCYVIDNYDMSITYHFSFLLTPVEQAIIAIPGILPKPAGVDDGLRPLPPAFNVVGFYIDSLPPSAQPYKPMSYGCFSTSY